MPSENKTDNLDLNQWQGNEYVKRQDFVDDNKKIDEAYEKLKKEIESKATDAEGTSYNNTTSKLESTNVQGAIDEVNAKTDENKTSISNHYTAINKNNEKIKNLEIELGNNINLLDEDIRAIREVL